MTDLSAIGPALEDAVTEAGLITMGVAPIGTGGSRVLLGAGAAFWDVLHIAPEGQDGAPDPVDRYSLRVITALADRFGATADFPFGGPPYAPFIAWALESGRAWSSPTGMLVHDTTGLMISYRGALSWPDRPHTAPDTQEERPSPCPTCAQPCVTACPVGALSAVHSYDVAACHAYLDTDAGAACLSQGCAVRRACPISARFGRDPAQSEHHMRAFHPT